MLSAPSWLWLTSVIGAAVSRLTLRGLSGSSSALRFFNDAAQREQAGFLVLCAAKFSQNPGRCAAVRSAHHACCGGLVGL